MKPFHEKNGAAIYVGRAATAHSFFFFFITFTLLDEYLNRDVSIGQLLQHISKYIVVCARSRPKMLT